MGRSGESNVKSNGNPPKDLEALKARAAARLAAMGNVLQPSTTDYRRETQLQRSRDLPEMESTWAVEDEVEFKPMMEEDDDLCIIDWPAAAANTVAESIRALSPRR